MLSPKTNQAVLQSCEIFIPEVFGSYGLLCAGLNSVESIPEKTDLARPLLSRVFIFANVDAKHFNSVVTLGVQQKDLDKLVDAVSKNMELKKVPEGFIDDLLREMIHLISGKFKKCLSEELKLDFELSNFYSTNSNLLGWEKFFKKEFNWRFNILDSSDFSVESNIQEVPMSLSFGMSDTYIPFRELIQKQEYRVHLLHSMNQSADPEGSFYDQVEAFNNITEPYTPIILDKLHQQDLLPFDLFLYLPTNKKVIMYRKKGNRLDEKNLQHLENSKYNQFMVQNADFETYKIWIGQHFVFDRTSQQKESLGESSTAVGSNEDLLEDEKERKIEDRNSDKGAEIQGSELKYEVKRGIDTTNIDLEKMEFEYFNLWKESLSEIKDRDEDEIISSKIKVEPPPPIPGSYIAKEKDTLTNICNQLFDLVNSFAGMPLALSPDTYHQMVDLETKLINIIVDQTVSDIVCFKKILSEVRNDNCLARHLFNSHILMISFLIGMGFKNKKTLINAGIAGLLHDIAISGQALLLYSIAQGNSYFSRYAYMYKEDKTFQSHPVLANLILEKNKIPITTECKLIIEQHHEYCDATGFPKRLKEKNIFGLAKLFCLLDILEECITLRDPSSPGVFKIDFKIGEEHFIKAIDRLGLKKFDKNLVKSVKHLLKFSAAK